MRLYNGCPDDELKAIWDERDAALKRARSLGILLTYFPVEGMWSASHLETYVPIGEFCHTPHQALEEALALLAKEKTS